MPLTFGMLEEPSKAVWLAIRLVLAIVGLASLGLVFALLRLRPRRPRWAYWLAVAGSVAYTIQTALLDAQVWPLSFHYRQPDGYIPCYYPSRNVRVTRSVEIRMRDRRQIGNRTSGYLMGLLIWCGIWILVLAFIARGVTTSVPPLPTDVSVAPGEPPEFLPDFPTPEATALPMEEQEASSVTHTPSPTAEHEEPPPTVDDGRAPAQSPPTRIVAPAIGLDSPVVPVGWHVEDSDVGARVVWDVASYAAGWHSNSAYPGNNGNVVLSGHNNVAGEVFRYLVDLKEGDEIRLYVEDTLYPYEVAGKVLLEEKGMASEVRRQNAQWIAPTDHERLTLVTCWPYSTYTHRLIVVALPPGTEHTTSSTVPRPISPE
jgi:sortase A